MTKESKYEIKLTPLALEMLEEIKDQRHLKIIGKTGFWFRSYKQDACIT